jgi:hypothetical protein
MQQWFRTSFGSALNESSRFASEQILPQPLAATEMFQFLLFISASLKAESRDKKKET